MKFLLTSDLQKQLRQIKTKQPQLFGKITKQLTKFQENHFYPSLRNHKLKGNLSLTWSISIEGNMRMLYYLNSGNVAVFFKIGTHDEVYKK